MNYEEWLEAVPEEIKGDRLWTVTAYKLAWKAEFRITDYELSQY